MEGSDDEFSDLGEVERFLVIFSCLLLVEVPIVNIEIAMIIVCVHWQIPENNSITPTGDKHCYLNLQGF